MSPDRNDSPPISSDMQRTGNWLFRHRSFLPLVLLPAVAVEIVRNADRLTGDPRLDYAWAFICAGAAFSGVIVRALVTGYAPPGTSGRNTTGQVANSLNTTGLYSLTRNPLYLGNLLIATGALAAARSWELSVVVFLIILLYYGRIVAAEAAFLSAKFGEKYAEWAGATPRLFPRLWGWRRPERRFSLRRVVRCEFYAACGIIMGVFLIEHARLGRLAGRFVLEPVWGIVWAAAAFVFVVVRTLKKRTRLLGDA